MIIKFPEEVIKLFREEKALYFHSVLKLSNLLRELRQRPDLQVPDSLVEYRLEASESKLSSLYANGKSLSAHVIRGNMNTCLNVIFWGEGMEGCGLNMYLLSNTFQKQRE